MGGCFISPAFKCAVTDEIVPSGGQNLKKEKRRSNKQITGTLPLQAKLPTGGYNNSKAAIKA